MATANPRSYALQPEGTIHDFVMLNALHDTPQAKAAVAQAAEFLKDAFAV
jgi:acetyl esterase